MLKSAAVWTIWAAPRRWWGDFHFNGERLLAEFPDCARALSKYRINPGNVGKGAKGDEKFAFMIRTAAEYDKAVRIGVNWGSLDQSLAKR